MSANAGYFIGLAWEGHPGANYSVTDLPYHEDRPARRQARQARVGTRLRLRWTSINGAYRQQICAGLAGRMGCIVCNQ